MRGAAESAREYAPMTLAKEQIQCGVSERNMGWERPKMVQKGGRKKMIGKTEEAER